MRIRRFSAFRAAAARLCVMLAIPSLAYAVLFAGLGLYTAAFASAVFSAGTAGSLVMVVWRGGERVVVPTLIGGVLALPLTVQYILGGADPAANLMIWGLLAPLVTLTFYRVRVAIAVFLLFIGGVIAVSIVDPHNDAAVPETAQHAFAIFNAVGICASTFSILATYVIQLRLAHRETNRLLLNILPRYVVDRLKRRSTVLADEYPNVSVLFADIVGFTTMAAHKSPAQVVRLLTRVFSRFDTLAYEHGVEKIKTIGDAYMAVAGLPQGEGVADARALADMALRMQSSVSHVKDLRGEPIALRIGLHRGPVMAGVIGRDKFAYDVWGDTVNVASRMESQGLPGRITISGEMRMALGDGYDIRPLGMVNIKGRGPMPVFELAGKVATSADTTAEDSHAGSLPA